VADARATAAGAEEQYIELGGGVWLRLGPPGAEIEVIRGRPCRRFMDHLYLPRPTYGLDVHAVKAINRWREGQLAHPGLAHRDRVGRPCFRCVRCDRAW
jgi:hypothetical protein